MHLDRNALALYHSEQPCIGRLLTVYWRDSSVSCVLLRGFGRGRRRKQIPSGVKNCALLRPRLSPRLAPQGVAPLSKAACNSKKRQTIPLS
ncbi:hypothetical protein VARIO8X_90071 [Burkholderiales bacterium 8X]|nr:hypothetical protein VARIO8X_90071 [Burkholderiales bacterium 8X]